MTNEQEPIKWLPIDGDHARQLSWMLTGESLGFMGRRNCVVETGRDRNTRKFVIEAHGYNSNTALEIERDGTVRKIVRDIGNSQEVITTVSGDGQVRKTTQPWNLTDGRVGELREEKVLDAETTAQDLRNLAARVSETTCDHAEDTVRKLVVSIRKKMIHALGF